MTDELLVIGRVLLDEADDQLLRKPKEAQARERRCELALILIPSFLLSFSLSPSETEDVSLSARLMCEDAVASEAVKRARMVSLKVLQRGEEGQVG